MKKFVVLALALAMLLAACGPANSQETQGQPDQATVDQTTAGKSAQPPETTAAAEPVISTQAPTQEPTQEATEPPASVPGADPELLAKAESCIDKTVEDLIALIGEPLTWDYAQSCLGDGEDGRLQYDGFYVETYRENGTEIVRLVVEGYA